MNISRNFNLKTYLFRHSNYIKLVASICQTKICHQSLGHWWLLGEKDNVNSYKPITITSCISKVLEKVMYDNLMKFINQNNIPSNEQHRFRNKRSMTTAIYECINSTLNSMDKKQETVGVIIDLSKAFDMVGHKILLSKRERYSIRLLPNN
ncbi:uncharacterized protein LOC124613526 [Schistocerca americana]|uniref:uncharacterized protein LOC124613526 n=1 Tax=Schistocerca americana TaxID=7009 RepID=UPI001F4F57C0|nr:uncharacterized protein LOC124613526 [Schistocerca americana]